MDRVKFLCLASLSLLLLVVAVPVAAQSSDSELSIRSIVVGGEGEVKAAPDEAMIPLMIRTEALEVEGAYYGGDEPSGRGSGGNMASYYAMMSSGYGGEMGSLASPGQLTFSMRVTVVFELE